MNYRVRIPRPMDRVLFSSPDLELARTMRRSVLRTHPTAVIDVKDEDSNTWSQLEPYSYMEDPAL